MKLAELLLNQKIIIQLTWGDEKIEFPSEIVENIGEAVYATAYIHKGAALKLNITEGTDVVCNVFADNPTTGQRVSWRNVELTTSENRARTLYCVRTRGFNNVASPDERRNNERTVIDISGTVTDTSSGEITNITVHDISGVGISFYAPKTYSPKIQQVIVTFTDIIEARMFDVKVECLISRTKIEEDHITVGCKFVTENRDYQLYRLIKHLKGKAVARETAAQEKASQEMAAQAVAAKGEEAKTEAPKED